MSVMQIFSRWLFGVCLFLSAQLCVADQAVMSFAETYAKALRESLVLKNAELITEQAKVDASIVDYNNDPRFNIQAVYGGQKPDRLTKEQQYSAELSYTLFDFGRNSSNKSRADKQIQLKLLSTDEVRETVKWEVAYAYARLVAAVRVEDTTREHIQISQSKLSTQKKNYEEGLRAENDVVTAEIELGKVKLSHLQAQDEVKQVQEEICFLINCDSSKVSVYPTKESLRMRRMNFFKSALEQLPSNKQTIAHKKLLASAELLDVETSIVNSTFRPQVLTSITAQTSGLIDNSLNDFGELYAAQLMFSWDIPWNGMSREQRQKISLQKQENEINLQLLDKKINNEETSALLQFESSLSQGDLIIKQLGLLRRQQQLTQQRYESGRASAIELSNTETDLLDIKLERIRLTNVLSNILISLAKVRSVEDPSVIFQSPTSP